VIDPKQRSAKELLSLISLCDDHSFDEYMEIVNGMKQAIDGEAKKWKMGNSFKSLKINVDDLLEEKPVTKSK
jgi:hypothetical protein